MKLKKPPTPAEMASWARSLNISSFSIIMVFLLVLGVVILSPGISTLIEQRRTIAELEESVRQRTAEVEVIEAERDRWKDPAFIRAQARDRLFFVMPGETQLSVIDDVVIAETVQQDAVATLTEQRRDWLTELSKSLLTAGLTPAPASESTP
jgi:cell division protein FtsB